MKMKNEIKNKNNKNQNRILRKTSISENIFLTKDF